MTTHPPPPPPYHPARKDTAVAYILWFLLGTFGVHRFYLRQTSTGVAQLVLNITGWATAIILVGIPLLVALWVWLVVDLFLIPGLVRVANGGRS